jgi:hypothetical protein
VRIDQKESNSKAISNDEMKYGSNEIHRTFGVGSFFSKYGTGNISKHPQWVSFREHNFHLNESSTDIQQANQKSYQQNSSKKIRWFWLHWGDCILNIQKPNWGQRN